MIFLSDLDKTLIFSYKRLDENNLCVEEKDGKKLSFMTHSAAEIFTDIIHRCEFIPLSTRSIEQYNRIAFPRNHRPKYAVCDNGGTLLIDGSPDSEWRNEILEIVSEAENELNICRNYLQKCSDVYFEIRMVDGIFLFTKCRNSLSNAEKLKAFEFDNIDIFTNGDKLYAIPKGVSKGETVKKIRRKFGGEIIAAGDSEFDRQMLALADIAVIKSGELCGGINKNEYFEQADDVDFTLKTVREILG